MRRIRRVAVTGGAGFIGSHLVDACLDRGFEVAVIDDLSVGRMEFIREHVRAGRLHIVQGDILAAPVLTLALEGADAVFHLAANPDARRGLENPRIDLELEVLTTFQVLETMRLLGIPRVVFASSGTVYGDVGTAEVSESYGPCRPVSLYGAGKAAAEAFLSAYSASFGLEAIVCRLGNVIGERATHGALFDFDAKLRRDSSRLEILGNGQQAKPYMYVRDLVDAFMFVALHAAGRFDTFNVAPRGATSVGFLARALLEELGLPETPLFFGESPAGWPGDIPQSRMNADKLARLGWSPRYSSDEAVKVGVREFVRHTRAGAPRAR
jgi:UDP-glucose 4-epimerase